MFAVSVHGLAIVIVLGIVAVGVIAWLLSPKDLSLDLDPFTQDEGDRPSSP